MSKYHNQKTTLYGETFDSKKEAERWLMLRQDERDGRITDLRRQVEFVLLPSMVGKYRHEREVKYIADFTYTDRDGVYHVIDVKSEITRKKPDYVIKRKLMLFRKGISIEEV